MSKVWIVTLHLDKTLPGFNLSRYYVYREKDMYATKKHDLLGRAKNLTGV